jgi:hypothetical protein
VGMNWSFSRSFEAYELRFATPTPPFDAEEEDRLIADLCRAMPSLKLREYFDYKRDMLQDSRHLVVAFAKDTGDALAILAVTWHKDNDRKFLHLATMLIGEKFQGTTLVVHMLGLMFGQIYRLDHEFPTLVSMKTYNARSYSLMNMFTKLREFGVELYPSVSGAEISPELIDTAERIAGVLSPGLDFSRDTGVIKGGAGEVPADFWPQFPRARDEQVNEYFQTQMTANDRLLCVLRSPTDTAKQRIMKIIGAGA